MNNQLMRLINELITSVNTLDSHVAPADSTGKRLIYEICERVKEISKLVQEQT